MVDNIIVITIIMIVVLYFTRRLFNIFSGKDSECVCGQGKVCVDKKKKGCGEIKIFCDER